MRTDVRAFFPTREQVQEARAVLVFAHSETINGLVPLRGRIDTEDLVLPAPDKEAALAWVDAYAEEIDEAFERVDKMMLAAIARYEARTEG